MANENSDRLTAERVVGAPDLVIEIVSPTSVYRDRDTKYHEYAQAGVAEYWVIDSRPDRNRADFFRLSDDGRYELFATEDTELVQSAVLPGFHLSPNWLWQDPFPNVITTLYQMSDETAVAIQERLQAE